MTDARLPTNAAEYLESLMYAGQSVLKKLDDTLVSAVGVSGKDEDPSPQIFPFGLIADLQREHLRQLKEFWRSWNAAFLQAFAGGIYSTTELAQGDKRFKDNTWQVEPYYDLLKQAYLL